MSNLKQCCMCGKWQRQWLISERLEDGLCPECQAYGDPEPQAGDRFYDAVAESQRSIAREFRRP